MSEEKMVTCEAYLHRGRVYYMHDTELRRGVRFGAYTGRIWHVKGVEADALRTGWEGNLVSSPTYYTKMDLTVPERYFNA